MRRPSLKDYLAYNPHLGDLIAAADVLVSEATESLNNGDPAFDVVDPAEFKLLLELLLIERSVSFHLLPITSQMQSLLDIHDANTVGAHKLSPTVSICHPLQNTGT